MADSIKEGFLSHHKNMSTKNLNERENNENVVLLFDPDINGLALYLVCQNNDSKNLVRNMIA